MKKIKVLTNVSLRLLCLAAVFVTVRGANAQTHSESASLSPGNPTHSWTISLDALESASYSVSIASSGDVDGKTYNFVYSKIAEHSGPGFFIWNISGSGQSYSFNVANTHLKPAVTKVTVECLWEATAGGGGGGGGGRDVIEGSASGTAEVHNEGPFWVEANKSPPYSGVGDPIGVSAFAGSRIAVDADWSVTGGSGTIQGSSHGSTVSVTSEESGETTVQGVYSDNTEFSDSESLTFVEVLAIEADPEVVCLGGEVNYIITTDPEGEEYESLVTHNEADTGVAGVYEILATCGTSSAETEVTVVEVLSVTCGEVTSTTADPGENETVYIYVGEEPENIVTITALLNPEVDTETLPEGCPAWQNAEPLEENPLKAEFLIDTPSDSVGDEANIVRVTCGDSEVALKIIVVKIDLVFEGLPEAPEDPPTEEDPPNEEEPGGFIMVNCNDNAGGENPGEGNDVMDMNDETPLQHPDPDLKPVTLMLLPDDLAQGKVTLDVPGNLMVWEDAEKNEPPGKVDDLLLEWEDPSGIPTSLYLEGYSPGAGNLTLTYEYEGKITCSDFVKMTALKVDLDVDADYDGGISFDEPDELLEMSDGGLVCVGDREPIIIRQVLPASWDGTVMLTKSSGKIKVFDEPGTNGNEIVFNGVDNIFTNNVLPVTLYVQGEEPSSAPRDVVLSLTSDPVGYSDQIAFTVLFLDLDIDSDNNNGFDAPDRSEAEDEMEDDPDLPGKFIAVNNGDIDKDGVPNFADGFDKFGNEGADAGGFFTPVILEIGEGVDLQEASIKFTYSCSNPDEATRTGSGTTDDPYIYTPGPGNLRIWKKDGSADRKKAEVDNEGDFIKSGSEYKAADLGEDRIITLYLEGIAPGAAFGDQRIVVEIDPDGEGQADYICSDAVRTTVFSVDIVPILTDEYGTPLISDGDLVIGQPIDVINEGFSTYCPDPGTQRGALTIETASHSEVWLQFTEHEDGSSAVLDMTHPDQERFAKWSLSRDYSAELIKRYYYDGGDDNYVVVERSFDSDTMSGFYDLTVHMKDEIYTESLNDYTIPFKVYPPLDHGIFSNYRLTGPPGDMGLPPYSDRNLFVFCIQGLTVSTMEDITFEAELEDDYETQTIQFTNVVGGKLCSDVIVPLLHIDKDRDLGLEGVGRTVYKVHFQKGTGISEVSEVRFSINAVVGASARKVANGIVPVKKAWLLTALLSDEANGLARAHYLGVGGETIVKQLGYEVTLSITPTKEQLLDLLPRHRQWLHSGHGHNDLGVTHIKKDGYTYRRAELTAADISGLGLTYELIFMNTCRSTDKYSRWVITNPFTKAGYYDMPVDLAVHKVYDIGKALNAQNYVGWDCDALRIVTINASRIFPQKLNSGLTVTEAVALTKEALDAYDNDRKGTATLLRAVDSNGSTFDLKR